MVIVEDYNPDWPFQFESLKQLIWPSVKDLAISIEHVGSTSVVGMVAKPVIDIDLVIESERVLPEMIARLRNIGYSHQGTQGIPGREAFRSSSTEIRHHLYVCTQHSLALSNHLRLRDRLRRDDRARLEYSRLKRELATMHPGDSDKYVGGKTGLIIAFLEEDGMSAADLDLIREANR